MPRPPFKLRPPHLSVGSALRFRKEWMLLIDGKEQGPYSIWDLFYDPRITPDTLVRREIEKEWRAAGDVPELRALFQDRPNGSMKEESAYTITPDGLAIDIRQRPPSMKAWLVLLGLLVAYFIYRMAIR